MASRATTAAAKARQSEQGKPRPEMVSRVTKLPAKVVNDYLGGIDPFTLTDYEQALAAFDAAGVALPEVDSERQVKAFDLIGVPLIVVDMRLIDSDKYTKIDPVSGERVASVFAYCTVVAEGLGRVGFATGAHGIVERVKTAMAQGVPVFRAPNGVRESLFDYTADDGSHGEAKSYWFA